MQTCCHKTDQSQRNETISNCTDDQKQRTIQVDVLPFASQQFTVYTNQKRADPKNEKHIDEVFLVERVIVDNGHGNGKHEAYDHWSPEIPFPQVINTLLAMLRQHQQYISNFPGKGNDLFDLLLLGITMRLRGVSLKGFSSQQDKIGFFYSILNYNQNPTLNFFYQSFNLQVVGVVFILQIIINTLRSNTMKKTHLVVVVEELQKENTRLKDQIITHQKDLNHFQNTMIEQLSLIGKVQPYYQTPLQCLNAYAQQFKNNLDEHLTKAKEINLLNESIVLKDRQYKELLNNYQQIASKNQETDQHLKTVEHNHKETESRLESQLIAALSREKHLNKVYKEMVEQNEIRDMEREEEKRASIAAAIASTKQEMLQYRCKLEEEFNKKSEQLFEQIKNRDESFKTLAKSFSKLQYRNQIKNEQITKIDKVLDKVLNFEELNSQIRNLRSECQEQKKTINDINNKKLHFQVRLSQLRTEITNHESKFKRKEIQCRTLAEEFKKTEVELEREKKGNKNLEQYYENKWVHEFDRVKRNIEKHYQDKLIEYGKQVEAKKGEISRKIESYLFQHNQDQKYIQQLKDQIAYKEQQAQKMQKTLQSQIEKLKNDLLGVWNIVSETNQMILESQSSFRYQSHLKQLTLNAQISGLQEQKHQIETKYSEAKEVIDNTQRELAARVQEQKQELLKIHEVEIQKMQEKQEEEIKAIEQTKQEKDQQFIQKEEMIRKQCDLRVIEIEKKVDAVREQKQLEIQQEKQHFKQFAVEALKKQKVLQRQVYHLRNELQSKVQYFETQMQNKKTNLKFQTQKSEKDQVVKRELRQLLDHKIEQNKILLKEKIDLMNEVEAKESDISHLKHELEQSIFTRIDWVRLTDDLKQQFIMDLEELTNIYTRQTDILKSKIWELENIILTKPIRAKDQLKIRHLSEKKRQLQSLVELKEAENGVLKQIKYFYEQKSQITKQSSEGVLNLVQQRKGPSVLIMARKHKKLRASQFQLSSREMGQTCEVREDVQKMKHYIASKFRQAASKEEKMARTSRFKTVYYGNKQVDK